MSNMSSDTCINLLSMIKHIRETEDLDMVQEAEIKKAEEEVDQYFVNNYIPF